MQKKVAGVVFGVDVNQELKLLSECKKVGVGGRRVRSSRGVQGGLVGGRAGGCEPKINFIVEMQKKKEKKSWGPVVGVGGGGW